MILKISEIKLISSNTSKL